MSFPLSILGLFVINTTLNSGLLCEILSLVINEVDGTLKLVAELIVPYGDQCKYVKYTQILVILGIKF